MPQLDERAAAVPASSTAAALRFRGADARRFLQGQLSNDMDLLAASALLPAGLHNPQGRALALLYLVAPAPDEVVALLPAELATATAATLKRYVLRSKVAIEVEDSADALAALAARSPALAPRLAMDVRTRDIAAGLPQVHAATSGAFVAQMLNLDCIGAIAFDKGCYTGQEVIARAHYRGRVKRRMQLFRARGAPALAPGASIVLGDGRRATVVDATTPAPDGTVNFLAVAALPAAAETPDAAAPTESVAPTGTGASDAAAATPLPRIDSEPLPLPYSFPH